MEGVSGGGGAEGDKKHKTMSTHIYIILYRYVGWRQEVARSAQPSIDSPRYIFILSDPHENLVGNLFHHQI